MKKRDFQKQEYATEAVNSPLIIEEWLEARKIIADFLQELNPHQTEKQYLHNAGAIIARLAQKNLLIEKVEP